MSAETEHDLSKYRPNVGIVVFNRDGLVWLGRRHATQPPFNWQFPQGGVDAGESFEEAARRELEEETGIRSVKLLAETEGWIVYDFPPGYGGSKAARGFLGQKQKWFAYRFEGEDREIDLEGHHEIEFDAWKWAKLEDAIETVVPFKRASYAMVIEAFRRFARA
ncbi:MAG TPA: RNA pyrophosphohydrolase [Caulobacteraceae bacterium]|nr:RNA pyrophosphohydrolase [Caulobacteraceae bacterium]